MLENIKEIINEIKEINGVDKVNKISENMHLRLDLGLDSMDLAILTAKIEDLYGVDIFETGIVNTIGEILVKLEK